MSAPELGEIDNGPAVEPDAAMEIVCRSALELIARTPGSLRMLSARLGPAAVRLEWQDAGEPPGVPMAAVSASHQVAEDPAEAERRLIRSPMVGTFYRAPEPGSAPFVRIGDPIEAGQPVGIIEAMKLMNIIESDVAGEIVDILVTDAMPVEYDQALVVIAPVETGG